MRYFLNRVYGPLTGRTEAKSLCLSIVCQLNLYLTRLRVNVGVVDQSQFFSIKVDFLYDTLETVLLFEFATLYIFIYGEVEGKCSHSSKWIYVSV